MDTYLWNAKLVIFTQLQIEMHAKYMYGSNQHDLDI